MVVDGDEPRAAVVAIESVLIPSQLCPLGTIPNEIGNMTKLFGLSLQSNKLSGEHSQHQHCRRRGCLRWLTLACPSGTIPHAIVRLKGLTRTVIFLIFNQIVH